MFNWKPVFNSQTKETLTTKINELFIWIKWKIFKKQITNSGIIERCLKYVKTREEKKALKKWNNKTKKSY